MILLPPNSAHLAGHWVNGEARVHSVYPCLQYKCSTERLRMEGGILYFYSGMPSSSKVILICSALFYNSYRLEIPRKCLAGSFLNPTSPLFPSSLVTPKNGRIYTDNHTYFDQYCINYFWLALSHGQEEMRRGREKANLISKALWDLGYV